MGQIYLLCVMVGLFYSFCGLRRLATDFAHLSISHALRPSYKYHINLPINMFLKIPDRKSVV